ncbi:hypothetical protein LEP1GSC060_0742 [Leptospira weilii serovar Ranarum str. ICFT]|uniref:Uncharacterized protein n=1 Tax=Leptospira weilii serovar Ranarum str. ICFT TaxID=1218598 RepID=N1WMH3_9LEPT|nr:hypothetical protein LEP1GSC060_0742 [Leptospira weilii serovar Ranarum str. ICFT]
MNFLFRYPKNYTKEFSGLTQNKNLQRSYFVFRSKSAL